MLAKNDRWGSSAQQSDHAIREQANWFVSRPCQLKRHDMAPNPLFGLMQQSFPEPPLRVRTRYQSVGPAWTRGRLIIPGPPTAHHHHDAIGEASCPKKKRRQKELYEPRSGFMPWTPELSARGQGRSFPRPRTGSSSDRQGWAPRPRVGSINPLSIATSNPCGRHLPAFEVGRAR